MEGTTWSVDENNSIVIGYDTIDVDGQITADKVKQVARDRGIRKFNVKDEDGELLGAEDFPCSGTVKVAEYNTAK